MAKPILSTPTVRGEDARELLDSLKHTASRDEMRARIEKAKEQLKPAADGKVYLVIPDFNDRHR